MPILLLPAGCSLDLQEGIDVELTLDYNGKVNTLVVANPDIKSVSECNEKFGDLVPLFEKHLPIGIPDGTKVTKWRCLEPDPK